MRPRSRHVMFVIAAVAAIALASLAVKRTGGQDLVSQVPRTPDGTPDFSGIWQANNTANWDLQTHVARPMVAQPGVYPDVQVLAAPVVALGSIGWVPGGLGVVEGDEIPYQPWAAARQQENSEHWLDHDPEVQCYLPGVPRAMYLPYPLQVFQGTDKIMMIFEFANAQRIIHMDEVEPYPNEAWMGHSVGRWEGETLVVDSTQFTPYTWFDRAGNFHSDALHVVERYSFITRDAIRYEATIEDVKVFTRPWTISMPLYRRLEERAQLTDFRCIEMVEETLYGHLRKDPVVTRWEGNTIAVDVTRRYQPGDAGIYDRHLSGNPPEER
jgi:hypothetical protein